MFNFKKKVLKRKLQSVEAGIIEKEMDIAFHQGLLDYEKDTLSPEQIKQYEMSIKADEAQIKTNKDYIRYIKPLL